MNNLFGVKFFTGSADEAQQVILTRLKSATAEKPLVVFTSNTEQLMLARRYPAFLTALQQADLNLPDSVGIVWAGNFLGLKPFAKRRIAGREMVSVLLPLLKRETKKVMFIGGMGNTAQRAADKVKLLHPELQVFSHHGSRDALHETAEEFEQIYTEIKKAQPDMVLVAYGAPTQEYWTLKHKEELGKAGVKVIMVVGGVLDLLSGKLKTAPSVASALGLEWLWRLVQEPKRLGRQMALPQFVLAVLRKKFQGR